MKTCTCMVWDVLNKAISLIGIYTFVLASCILDDFWVCGYVGPTDQTVNMKHIIAYIYIPTKMQSNPLVSW